MYVKISNVSTNTACPDEIGIYPHLLSRLLDAGVFYFSLVGAMFPFCKKKYLTAATKPG
jgi:hypothetical protein